MLCKKPRVLRYDWKVVLVVNTGMFETVVRGLFLRSDRLNTHINSNRYRHSATNVFSQKRRITLVPLVKAHSVIHDHILGGEFFNVPLLPKKKKRDSAVVQSVLILSVSFTIRFHVVWVSEMWYG